MDNPRFLRIVYLGFSIICELCADKPGSPWRYQLRDDRRGGVYVPMSELFLNAPGDPQNGLLYYIGNQVSGMTSCTTIPEEPDDLYYFALVGELAHLLAYVERIGVPRFLAERGIVPDEKEKAAA